MPIPGPKTTITLQERTDTKSAIGSYSTSWSTVQTLLAVIQPVSANEKIALGKPTTDQMWWIFVADDQFSSDANRAKLKTKNRITISDPALTLDILSVQPWRVIAKWNHYQVLGLSVT